MKKPWQNLWGRLSAVGGDAKVRLLVLVGVAGMLLIALTEWLPHRSATVDAPVFLSAAQVEQALERRITDLLDAVAGVGRCQVMVTLENGEQTVYAADTTRSVTEGGESSTESFLTVDTADGPVGLPLTRIQPTVRGVVVVCAGAEDPTVCRRVQSVITTAFHISERRVCVVQQK